MTDFSANLQRLMARLGLTIHDVVDRSGLDERTIKGILSGSNRRPHAQTLHKLASGLGTEVDELFQNAGSLTYRQFDRQTNPIVDEVIAARPELFRDWAEPDFDQLYSRFGVGGGLTFEGALEAVHMINRSRKAHQRVEVLLESSEAGLLLSLVDVLYRRVVIVEPDRPGDQAPPRG